MKHPVMSVQFGLATGSTTRVSTRLEFPRKETMRTLTLVSTSQIGQPNRATIRLLEKRDEYPRTVLYEDELHSDILDEEGPLSAPGFWRILYPLLPAPVAQVLEAYRLRRRYDAIITWSPRLSLLFALLLKVRRSQTPHIALMSWISASKKAILLKYCHSHISRLVFWSSVQRRFAIERLGIPPSKTSLVHRRADHLFWRPMNVPSDTICSAGQEMRDFVTLVEALRETDIPCHIATGTFGKKTFDTVKALQRLEALPPTITIGKMAYVDLRNLYARSRFIVVPLLDSDTDNGAGVIEAAMAMGKAVICSKTGGQVDIILPGKTGLLVPPGDPDALRKAILYLWNNPSVAEQMGREGRSELECHHTLDRFVADVKQIVLEVIGEPSSAIPEALPKEEGQLQKASRARAKFQQATRQENLAD